MNVRCGIRKLLGMKPSEVTPEWITDRLAVTGRRQGDLARALGISEDKLSKSMTGKRQLTATEREKAMEVLLSPPAPDSDEAEPFGSGQRFAEIPRYDVQLSGGAGASIFASRPLDHIPFTQEFLRRRLGRENTRGLVMFEARGDSMEPIISDGDLVLVDTERTAITGTISAFRIDNEAFIKRLQRTARGIMAVSDNGAYPPFEIGPSEMQNFALIGQVRWIGRVL